MKQVTAQDAKARRAALAQFLKARRARIKPDDVGIAGSSRRRAQGLLREEVAQLCGISTTWYTWLEQAREANPSTRVIDRLATVLRLDRAERMHLLRLARPDLDPGRAAAIEDDVPESLRAIVSGLTINPAYVINTRADILAWNDAACALLGDFAAIAPDMRNVLRLMFSEPRWRTLFVDWDRVAETVVAQFRVAALDLAADPVSTAMIDGLRADSPEFARLWSRQDVSHGRPWRKAIAHPSAGRMDFHYASLRADGPRDLRLTIYTAADAESAARFGAMLEHDPEKWESVFGKDHAQEMTATTVTTPRAPEKPARGPRASRAARRAR